MRFYVISNEKCAVKINGIYLGTADGNLKYFEHCGHNLLIEFYPSDVNYSPISIVFDKAKCGFFGDIACVRSQDGYLIFPILQPKVSTKSHKIFTKSFTERQVGVSVIADPTYKIFISNATDCYFVQPKYFSENAKITARLFENLLTMEVAATHTYLYVFTVADKIDLLYSEEISAVDFTDCITIKKQPVGVTGCVTCEKYSFSDFSLCEKKLERTRSIYGLKRELIPSAFLEELRHGGNISDYLSHTIKCDNRLIAEFFGDFLFFIPYVFMDELYCALVYADKVETVWFTLSSDNTITDFSFV